LHLLPFGRVPLQRTMVSASSAQRSSECDRLRPTMISYLRRAGYLLISASLLAAGSFRVPCALSYLLLVGAILAIYTPLRFDGTPGEVAKALGESLQKVIDFNGVLASLAVVLTQKLDGEKVLDELRDALLAKDDDS
jgi:hypothetical protein